MAGDEVLAGYRESIDNIDAALVFMLAERFKITQAVGAYKAKAGLRGCYRPNVGSPPPASSPEHAACC